MSSNIIKFPGEGEQEETTLYELCCPEEGCESSFFSIFFEGETEEVQIRCARCDTEVNPYPTSEE